MPADANPSTAAAARSWARLRRLLGWLFATLVMLLAAALRLALHHGREATIRALVIAAVLVAGTMLAGATLLALRLARGRHASDTPRRGRWLSRAASSDRRRRGRRRGAAPRGPRRR